MILFALISLAAAPAELACEISVGTAVICTELRLAKDEDPKPFTDNCAGGKGVVKSHCEREAAMGKCSMGDTTLFYSPNAKTSAGEAAGLIKVYDARTKRTYDPVAVAADEANSTIELTIATESPEGARPA